MHRLSNLIRGALASLAILGLIAATPASATTYLYDLTFGGPSVQTGNLVLTTDNKASDTDGAVVKDISGTLTVGGSLETVTGLASFTGLLGKTSDQTIADDGGPVVSKEGLAFSTSSGLFDIYNGFDGLELNTSVPGGSLPLAFVNLSGPTIAGVPEPATWAVILIGFGSIGIALRRRRRMAVA